MRNLSRHFNESLLPLLERHHIRSILAAVSGGIDSMSLLRLLVHARPSSGYQLFAIHIHHGLREHDADHDEDVVKKVCTELDVFLFHQRIAPSDWGETTGTGIQEKARNLRYKYCYEFMSTQNIDTLAVGHHRDDLLETLLFNLIRGTSPEKLADIMPAFENKRRILRPLLPYSKDMLERYLEEKAHPFCLDKSNLNLDYTRNVLRNQIIPQLKEINPKVDGALFRFREILKNEQEYMKKNLADLVRPPLWENQIASMGLLRIRRPLLLELHFSLQIRILLKARREVAGHGHDFYYPTLLSICKGIHKSPQFRYNDKTMNIWTEKNWVYFSKVENEKK